MNKAIFLDRDGVLNKNKKHGISIWKEFEFLPHVFGALKKVNDYKKIIITNQAKIGRGAYTEKEVKTIHKKMLQKLKQENVKIDDIFYCPHKPEDNCNCRKPKTGMIDKAVKKFDIDIKNSWLIGDKTSDIKLGKNVGCKTILLKTGHAGQDNEYNTKPDFIAKNLLEAINIINSDKG